MKLRITVGALALIAVVGALAGWAFGEYRTRLQLETFLENERQRSLEETIDHIQAIGTGLGKGLVSGSPRQGIIHLTEAWRHASQAQGNFTRLPVTNLGLQNTSRFLTQVGDFSYSLAKQHARGVPLNGDQWDRLRDLQAQAANISAQLNELRGQVSAERLRFTPSPTPFQTLTGRNIHELPAPLSDGLMNLDTETQESPALIYDGPFSDHIEQAAPKGLGPGQITPEEARQRALAFVPKAEGSVYDARVIEDKTLTKIPSYSVEVSPSEGAAGDTFTLDISRQGGQVVWMISDREPGPDGITVDQARQAAVEFLKSRGFTTLVPTYSMSADGTAVIAFAHSQDGVIVYPDLIKVKVARDTGTVSGFEALGFLMAHHQRSLPQPTVSADQARESLNPRLEILSQRLSLIPLETLEEVLTWEFRTRLGETTFLIYINALTGDEERILQVIDAPDGTFTM